MRARTKVDELVELTRRTPLVPIQEAAAKLKMDPLAVERIAKILAKEGVLEISFPLNVMRKPFIKIGKGGAEGLAEKQEAKKAPKVIESYKVQADCLRLTPNF